MKVHKHIKTLCILLAALLLAMGLAGCGRGDEASVRTGIIGAMERKSRP